MRAEGPASSVSARQQAVEQGREDGAFDRINRRQADNDPRRRAAPRRQRLWTGRRRGRPSGSPGRRSRRRAARVRGEAPRAAPAGGGGSGRPESPRGRSRTAGDTTGRWNATGRNAPAPGLPTRLAASGSRSEGLRDPPAAARPTRIAPRAGWGRRVPEKCVASDGLLIAGAYVGGLSAQYLRGRHPEQSQLQAVQVFPGRRGRSGALAELFERRDRLWVRVKAQSRGQDLPPGRSGTRPASAAGGRPRAAAAGRPTRVRARAGRFRPPEDGFLPCLWHAPRGRRLPPPIRGALRSGVRAAGRAEDEQRHGGRFRGRGAGSASLPCLASFSRTVACACSII